MRLIITIPSANVQDNSYSIFHKYIILRKPVFISYGSPNNCTRCTLLTVTRGKATNCVQLWTQPPQNQVFCDLKGEKRQLSFSYYALACQGTPESVELVTIKDFTFNASPVALPPPALSSSWAAGTHQFSSSSPSGWSPPQTPAGNTWKGELCIYDEAALPGRVRKVNAHNKIRLWDLPHTVHCRLGALVQLVPPGRAKLILNNLCRLI